MLGGKVRFSGGSRPSFPDELPHDDDRVEEGDPEAMARPCLSVHHTSFL